MSAFINCICDHDFSGLTKSGNPAEAQIQQAWDSIFNEYLALSNDTQMKQILALMKEIAIITYRLQLIELIVGRLADGYIDGLGDQLRKMGFRFDYKNNENLGRELEMTIRQAKSQLIQLNQSKNELEELRKGDGKAATKADYKEIITELSKFQGYRLDPEILKVDEYCMIMKRFKAFYKPKAA